MLWSALVSTLASSRQLLPLLRLTATCSLWRTPRACSALYATASQPLLSVSGLALALGLGSPERTGVLQLRPLSRDVDAKRLPSAERKYCSTSPLESGATLPSMSQPAASEVMRPAAVKARPSGAEPSSLPISTEETPRRTPGASCQTGSTQVPSCSTSSRLAVTLGWPSMSSERHMTVGGLHTGASLSRSVVVRYATSPPAESCTVETL
mmetsp:Transcript_9225/g.23373  ORF Transcript_9225/g.23373 Transcript_9225/m.23373 type:complete len:210 (-) Transcript_9225:556-1185(-)